VETTSEAAVGRSFQLCVAAGLGGVIAAAAVGG